MEQPVIILDEESGFPLGAEIGGILQREGSYRICLVHQAGIALSNSMEIPAGIVIPVLPSSLDRAETLLAQFRRAPTVPHLLPVVRSEFLSELYAVLAHSFNDFLITPLRELEVCARVRRMVESRAEHDGNIATEGVMASLGLTPLVGEDPDFKAMKRKISLLARSECTVLITGETGTGKELCARAMHYLSCRAGCPFLPLNCGAIPVELFENELFGHEKGAFTGAWTAQSGLIAEAEGGTLFLDEIEALNLVGQAKLLRFLQDQTYYSLGSARSRQANVRIIASTNVELRSKIREGTFREDLYHRLAVINLSVAPLRERTSDIPALAEHFWKIYMSNSDRPGRSLSAEAIEVLCRYSWPGNVRELQNVIQQIIVLGESESVKPNDLPSPFRRTGDESGRRSFRQGKVLAIEAFEKNYVTETLRVNHGNVTKAANDANKDRRAFGRLIKKYDVRKR